MRLILALALALTTPAQGEEPAALRAPTLDVIVADERGRPVESLTPADLAVTQDGVVLAIDALRFVRANGLPVGTPPAVPPTPHEPPVVREDARLFGIFLDEFHVTPGPGAERARAALLRFVREELGPGDRVAIVKPLDSSLRVTLSADLASAAAAIEGFSPRNGDYTPRTSFEQEFIAGSPARVVDARAQIVVSALNGLVTELGRHGPSRKTLILLSEGFSVSTSARRMGEGLPSLRTLVHAANRAHVAVYPVRPLIERPVGSGATPAVPEGDGTRMRGGSLQMLAADTNGRATLDVPDVMPGLRQAMADASGYYLLTLAPVPQPTGIGLFHDVTVSPRRAGLQIRARKGYWSASEEELHPRPSSPPSFLSSFAARIPRRVSPLIVPWFGMSPGPGGATRVDFVWEPALGVPGDRNRRPDPTEVALSVTTLDGMPVFDGVVFPSTGGAAGSTAARQTRASFDAPAGRLLVQMAIRDSGARVIDRDARDLIVGGFPGPVSLGSAEVLRARTARELQALTNAQSAPPVAARRFSRAERLIVRVPVFTNGATPAVSARLVSGFGTAMRSLDVTPTPSREGVYQIDLPLSGLAAGSYAIEVFAATSEGEARDRLSFRVTP